MGYSIERTTYKVFVIEHNTIEKSVNVIFDETKFPGIIDDQANEPLHFENQGYLEEVELMSEDTRVQPDSSNVDQPNQKEESAQSHDCSEHHLVEHPSPHVDFSHVPPHDDHVSSESLTDRNLPRATKWNKDHIDELIIGDPSTSVRIRRNIMNECMFACFLSQSEPKHVDEALLDPNWVIAM